MAEQEFEPRSPRPFNQGSGTKKTVRSQGSQKHFSLICFKMERGHCRVGNEGKRATVAWVAKMAAGEALKQPLSGRPGDPSKSELSVWQINFTHCFTGEEKKRRAPEDAF